MTPDARKRFAALTSALAVYAAGCAANNTPNAETATPAYRDLPNVPRPLIDRPDDYEAPRPTQRRAARTRPPRTTDTRGGGRPGGDVWRALATCESGMRQDATSPSGRYLSYFQWSAATWRSVGGVGDPRDASYETQVALAERLQARSGWSQWPACSAKLGLR